jgi:hypothetical protein
MIGLKPAGYERPYPPRPPRGGLTDVANGSVKP